MSRITEKLSTLNVLRGAIGKAPLASWKNSEAELDQRIADLTPGKNLGAKVPQEPDRTEVLEAMAKAQQSTEVPVTVVPPAAELAKPAKRKAIIEKIAADSVAADKPTTVIDAKAASSKLRKNERIADDANKARNAKVTKKQDKKSTKAKTSTPKSDNAFGALLTKLGMTADIDKKKARQKLRNSGMSAPYTDLAKIEQVLTTDGRKKKNK